MSEVPTETAGAGKFNPEAFAMNLARAMESSGKALAAWLKPRDDGEAKDKPPAELNEMIKTFSSVAEYWLSDQTRSAELQLKLGIVERQPFAPRLQQKLGASEILAAAACACGANADHGRVRRALDRIEQRFARREVVAAPELQKSEIEPRRRVRGIEADRFGKRALGFDRVAVFEQHGRVIRPVRAVRGRDFGETLVRRQRFAAAALVMQARREEEPRVLALGLRGDDRPA